jgi:hypothetical protein
MSCQRNSKLRWILTVACLMLAAQASAGGAIQQSEPVFVFKQDSLPEPPQQKLSWTSPRTRLPDALVSAIARLFEQGLTDPRGCEYREVKVVVGSIWGGAAEIKTHAWVLPSNKDQRYVVTWSGLVYPAVSVGEKADLQLDVRTLIQRDEEGRAKWARERPNWPFTRYQHAAGEGYNVSHETLQPLKACLLLRLGESGLAEQLWAAWLIGTADSANQAGGFKNPYDMLASEWAWAMFDRALCAHMRGDDKLALLSARALVTMRQSILAEVARLDATESPGKRRADDAKGYYLNFLHQLPALLADQERRDKEGKHDVSTVRAALTETSRNPKAGASTQALIASLDQIALGQSGQPGGVGLGEAQAIRELVARGEEAVEPLLQVLENDTRLTRSVGFHRDFFQDRHILGVHEAAYVALVEILKTSSFLDDSNYAQLTGSELDVRRALAGRIRLYLEKYGRVPVEERWYMVLANDRASITEWTQAAANIVHPYDEGVPPAWAFTYAPTPAERAGKGIVLRSEKLRRKTSPSVSDLFVRRMFELAQRKDGTEFTRLEGATNLALALLAWDGQKELAEVRRLQESVSGLYATDDGKDPYRRAYLRGLLVSLYLKRVEAGDFSALSEYTSWLSTMKPQDAGDSVIYLFRPMWKFAYHPAVRDADERMFNAQGSPWTPLIDMNRRESFYAAQLLETPMLNLPGFFHQVHKGLKDKSVVAALNPRSTANEYELTVENPYAAVLTGAINTATAYFRVPDDDPRAARPLARLNIRACDVYASRLKRLSGAPKFEVYWTEAERDLAIANLIEFLNEHKERFASPSGLY